MFNHLQELHRLLTKHHYSGQAEVVARLIAYLPINRPAFVCLLQSVEMWGGSGAVWEVGELEADQDAFRAAIIALADSMEAEGIGLERSRFIARTFRKWKRLGV